MNWHLLCSSAALAAALLLTGCNDSESATSAATSTPAAQSAPTPAEPAVAPEVITEAAPATTPATMPETQLADASDGNTTAAPRSLAEYQSSLARRCETDADCTVKNVGSCCGYTPQCVHKDVQTFPEQVKALCEQEGRSSICGFQEPAGCSCVNNQCRDSAGSGI